MKKEEEKHNPNQIGKEKIKDFSFLRKKQETPEKFRFGKWSIIFLVLALIFAALAVKMTFFYTEKCEDLECFQSAMKECDKARYTNDAEEATWGYKIHGEEKGECLIEVELLQVKSGSLGLDGLQNLKMTCNFKHGIVEYPEKDLDKCHGRLKEEMQSIIIENLHKYILDNLDEIGESLN
jgi:hypothetical protein